MKESSILQQYPISSYTEQITQQLKQSPTRTLILTAQTGTGKSTVLPAALLNDFEGRFLMTQPRRIAAVGVADRISENLGEESGRTCGYKIHLENKISKETRLFVVTQAILMRELASDPFLSDYSLIILDEFHERPVTLDSSLVLLKEAMTAREDLYLIIMSATIDAKPLSTYLGGCPIIEIPGKLYDVETVYAPQKSITDAVLEEFYNLRKDVSSEAEKSGASILVFLPGISEINANYSILHDALARHIDTGSAELCILHSSIDLNRQKKILQPADKGTVRIILSSAIAETSLTVPDVKVVVDSGSARLNSLDVKTRMQRLITVTESQFNADQRKGRAGRTQNGRCIRLWPKTQILAKQTEPEIRRVELLQTVMEFANHGYTDIHTIGFITPPSEGAWAEAADFCCTTGLLDSSMHITKKGKAVLSLGIDLRLGAVCLNAWSACKSCDTPQEQSLLDFALDFYINNSSYSKASKDIQAKAKKDVLYRLEKTDFKDDCIFDESTLILSGYYDRLAKRLGHESDKNCIYQFTSGRKAIIAFDSPNRQRPLWICAPEVLAGTDTAVIFSFRTIFGPLFDKWLLENTKEVTKTFFEDGKISKTNDTVLGKIVLKSVKIQAQPDDLAEAWLNEIQNKGFGCLPSDNKIQSLINRCAYYEQETRTSMIKEFTVPDTPLEERLCLTAGKWLSPFLSAKPVLDTRTLYDALYWFLDGSLLDREVPELLVLENGRKVKVVYDKSQEITASIQIIIQKIFGCKKTPEILGRKVVLKLLSPASRPLQITSDLEGFWNGAWQEICKEMKGRYPKHNWDKSVCTENFQDV